MNKNKPKKVLSLLLASSPFLTNSLATSLSEVKPQHINLKKENTKKLQTNAFLKKSLFLEKTKNSLNKHKVYLLIHKKTFKKNSKPCLSLLIPKGHKDPSFYKTWEKKTIRVKLRQVNTSRENKDFRRLKRLKRKTKTSKVLTAFKKPFKFVLRKPYKAFKVNLEKAKALTKYQTIKKKLTEKTFVNPLAYLDKGKLSKEDLLSTSKRRINKASDATKILEKYAGDESDDDEKIKDKKKASLFPVFGEGFLYQKEGYKPICPVFLDKNTAEDFCLAYTKQAWEVDPRWLSLKKSNQKPSLKSKLDLGHSKLTDKWTKSKKPKKKIRYLPFYKVITERRKTEENPSSFRDKLLFQVKQLGTWFENKVAQGFGFNEDPFYDIVSSTTRIEEIPSGDENEQTLAKYPRMPLTKKPYLKKRKYADKVLEKDLQSRLKAPGIVSLGLGDFLDYSLKLSNQENSKNLEFVLVPDLRKSTKNEKKEAYEKSLQLIKVFQTTQKEVGILSKT